MNEAVTKEDLRQFSLLLCDKIEFLFKNTNLVKSATDNPEWLKSRAVRKLLDISAASLQSLRVTQKVRCKKVMGSYYYNKTDLMKLFNHE